MIDTMKKYKTRSGKKVINLAIIEKNGNSQAVTYPVKGSIVVREKPLKLAYAIWSSEGISDVIWGKHSDLDLVEDV